MPLRGCLADEGGWLAVLEHALGLEPLFYVATWIPACLPFSPGKLHNPKEDGTQNDNPAALFKGNPTHLIR